MTAQILYLRGCEPAPAGVDLPVQEDVNDTAVKIMADLHEMAKHGELNSFFGVGFRPDGESVHFICHGHPMIYEIVGCLEALKNIILSETAQA